MPIDPVTPVGTEPLAVRPVPAFSDNYIWLLTDADAQRAAVVDPGDAAPVLQRLRVSGTELVAILVTHHHGDHVGGIRQLLAAFPGIPVFGPAGESIPGITRPLWEGDTLHIESLDTQFQVLAVPGHTAGHIAYYGDGRLFCGDTLFACGCGRVFDGTLEQLAASVQRIGDLPGATLAYCAHEYTLDNIGFAKWVEPGNPALAERERETHAMLSADLPSVPSTIGLERATNPFLRLTEPAVVAAAERWAGRELHGNAEVFAALRTWKDRDYD